MISTEFSSLVYTSVVCTCICYVLVFMCVFPVLAMLCVLCPAQICRPCLCPALLATDSPSSHSSAPPLGKCHYTFSFAMYARAYSMGGRGARDAEAPPDFSNTIVLEISVQLK